MNGQWLAAVYEATGSISRGRIEFFVKGELSWYLYNFLKKHTMRPRMKKRSVEITRRRDIRGFYVMVKPFLITNRKREKLSDFIRGGTPWCLSDEDKLDICNKSRNGASAIELSAEYGVSRQTIYNVRRKCG
jgi:hypothetical protein